MLDRQLLLKILLHCDLATVCEASCADSQFYHASLAAFHCWLLELQFRNSDADRQVDDLLTLRASHRRFQSTLRRAKGAASELLLGGGGGAGTMGTGQNDLIGGNSLAMTASAATNEWDPSSIDERALTLHQVRLSLKRGWISFSSKYVNIIHGQINSYRLQLLSGFDSAYDGGDSELMGKLARNYLAVIHESEDLKEFYEFADSLIYKQPLFHEVDPLNSHGASVSDSTQNLSSSGGSSGTDYRFLFNAFFQTCIEATQKMKQLFEQLFALDLRYSRLGMLRYLRKLILEEVVVQAMSTHLYDNLSTRNALKLQYMRSLNVCRTRLQRILDIVDMTQSDKQLLWSNIEDVLLKRALETYSTDELLSVTLSYDKIQNGIKPPKSDATLTPSMSELARFRQKILTSCVSILEDVRKSADGLSETNDIDWSSFSTLFWPDITRAALNAVVLNFESLLRANTLLDTSHHSKIVSDLFTLLLDFYVNDLIKGKLFAASTKPRPPQAEYTFNWIEFGHRVYICDMMNNLVEVYLVQGVQQIFPSIDLAKAREKFETECDEIVGNEMEQAIFQFMEHVQHVFDSNIDVREYELQEMAIEMKPSASTKHVVDLLQSVQSQIFEILDKNLLDLLHAEIASRLFSKIVDHMKRHTCVTASGGFQVICDMNAYYSVFDSWKLSQDSLLQYEALKEIGNVYIVDASGLKQILHQQYKERFREALKMEEILELVSLRSDWNQIKNKVESQCSIC